MPEKKKKYKMRPWDLVQGDEVRWITRHRFESRWNQDLVKDMSVQDIYKIINKNKTIKRRGERRVYSPAVNRSRFEF